LARERPAGRVYLNSGRRPPTSASRASPLRIRRQGHDGRCARHAAIRAGAEIARVTERARLDDPDRPRPDRRTCRSASKSPPRAGGRACEPGPDGSRVRGFAPRVACPGRRHLRGRPRPGHEPPRHADAPSWVGGARPRLSLARPGGRVHAIGSRLRVRQASDAAASGRVSSMSPLQDQRCSSPRALDPRRIDSSSTWTRPRQEKR
jgi:hypothetical protein